MKHRLIVLFRGPAVADAAVADAVAAEREACAQLAIGKAEEYDDVIEPQHHAAAGALRLFADLIRARQ